MIARYYCLPCQQEFLIRHARQFTGLTDCQGRRANKIEHHLNAALTAVNVARVEQGLSASEPFLMDNAKKLNHNHLPPDRFIPILPKGVEVDKNDPKVRQI